MLRRGKPTIMEEKNKHPLKILFLARELSYRGMGIYTLNLAEGLHQRGHNVKILCGGGGLIDEFIRRKIPVSIYEPILKPWTELFSATRLLREAKNHGADLIHIQTPHLADLGARLSIKTRLPYLITIPHINTLRKRLKIRRKWMREVITLTESAREHLVNETRIPKEIIQVIYAGVNLNHLKPNSPSNEFGYKTVVGIIGPLEEWRGHKYFIEAAQEVLAQNAEVQFLIVGEGPLENRLRKQSRKLGINKSMTFLANITDYYNVLPRIDIFVFPILQMGMGVTILEAMGCGKPVIISAVGDTYRLIKEGETGFLIPPHNAQAIKDKLLDLLNNKILTLEVGMRARQYVEKNFTAEKMTEQTLQLYYNICSTGPPTTGD